MPLFGGYSDEDYIEMNASLRQRIAELEHKLALIAANELRIRSKMEECVALIERENLEGARMAERMRATLAGEES